MRAEFPPNPTVFSIQSIKDVNPNTILAGGTTLLTLNMPVRNGQLGLAQYVLFSGSKGGVAGSVQIAMRPNVGSVAIRTFSATGLPAFGRENTILPGDPMNVSLCMFFQTLAAGTLIMEIFGTSAGSDFTVNGDGDSLAVMLFN